MAKASGYKGMEALPSSGRALVEAARRVLLKKGYVGLTLDAIEAEARLNRSLVAYYFGSKEGLVEAVVDSLFPASEASLAETLEHVPSGEERVRALVDLQRRVSADDDVNRVFYELLPHILRDKKLRGRFARAYRASRKLDAGCIESAAQRPDRARAERLATLTVAVLEGLAMQREIDPKGLDHDGAFEEWGEMLIGYLQHKGVPGGD